MPNQRREKMWSSKELISTLRVFRKGGKLVVLARRRINLLPHRLFCRVRQPAPPFPVKKAPSSKESSLVILQMSPPRNKRDFLSNKDEASSQSSEEAVLLFDPPKGKGNKKTVEGKPDASPGKVSLPLEELPSKEGSPEQKSTPTSEVMEDLFDMLEGGEEASNDTKEGDEVEVKEEPEDLESFLNYLRRVGNCNKQLLFPWLDATGYPKVVQLDVAEEEIPAYIERMLKDSHKWKDEKDVLASIEEIDEEDKIVRTTDKFVRNLFLRLGQALDPQMEVAKAHAASMEEAANSWQHKAIKAIEDAVAGVKKDNQGVVRDIMDESLRNTKELKRQLDELNKKYTQLQTEHAFTTAELSMKKQLNEDKVAEEDTGKITALTLELGEQRKMNPALKSQIQTLLASFSKYRAGHLKEQVELTISEKKKDSATKDDSKGGAKREGGRAPSPTWGKI
jgi:hypothetical protein